MPNDMDPITRKALNDLARHQMLLRLLADIKQDVMVCKLEGWDMREFPRIIRDHVERWC